MPPTSSRDFQRAASQRLIAAKTLFDERVSLDSRYLGGHVVECTIKALILELTPDRDKQDRLKKITSGAAMHRPFVLLGELRLFGVVLPLMIARRFRRFHWSTDLRYESGRRDLGETKAFLKTAQAILAWVEEQLP